MQISWHQIIISYVENEQMCLMSAAFLPKFDLLLKNKW